ncbi:5573_t:CDS:1, partial [Cetraspora pellucida]
TGLQKFTFLSPSYDNAMYTVLSLGYLAGNGQKFYIAKTSNIIG